jgi:photosystem II stability/assembly factor-like uncharacterized protein
VINNIQTLALVAVIGTKLSATQTVSAQFDDGTKKVQPKIASEGSLAPLLDFLNPRQLGPTNMGGRIMDFAVVESNPNIFYVASASGGLWKTVNAGNTFDCVWDNGSSVSLGAVGICQANPDVIYLGTGEQSSRNSVAWGDGVYKSTDGGKTWAHIGLEKTMHISKVIVHPTNPNIAYVGALGRLWGRNPERGVYKTIDGGKTWNLVYHDGDRAGIIDLDMDPKNPNVLYACAWDRIRKAYVFASGGQESMMLKSNDAGKTWKRMTHGLPAGQIGRTGISVYHKNPNVLVATVEYRLPGQTSENPRNPVKPPVAAPITPASTTTTTPTSSTSIKVVPQKEAPKKEAPKTFDPLAPVEGSQFNRGGLFMSRDGGESWKLLRQISPRSFYFSNPLIDPNDDKKIYVCGMNLHLTKDYGVNWSVVRADALHADHHALWIDPKNSNHILDGNDGGTYQSRDGGANWEHLNKMPIGQFYAASFDGQIPYKVYGGLQDNGSWSLPTQHPRGAVGPWDAVSLNGGDGFYSEADTVESEWIYSESQGGAVARLNQKTGQRRGITPSLAGEKLRFNWNTPILISPHDNKTIYIGSNRLMVSPNRGEPGSWKAASPDLTTNNGFKQATALLSSRISLFGESTGAENHCTIVTISESPVVKGQLATGSDDGLVHVSTNGGENWTNVTPNIPGLPEGLWCSRVTFSKWQANRIYVTFDGHRSNDFKPYIFVSEDLGKTWKSLANGLADYDSLYVVREGEQNPNLLYLGSEMSLRFSNDLGKSWSRIRGKFPTVAVHDIRVHSKMKDIVVATHGRSIWTIDVAALEGMGTEVPTKAAYLGSSPGVQMGFVSGNPLEGDSFFSVPNTQPSARIYYFLPEGVKALSVTLKTADGKSVIIDRATKNAGFNIAVWNPRIDGLVAPAGKYEVVINVDGVNMKGQLEVLASKQI